ncbi:hypothetical protein HAALTHF_30060n [Vreelandella aquamarina]|nr:hypothetical protein HAALTHF_30060n [Halomonas axialensis]
MPRSSTICCIWRNWWQAKVEMGGHWKAKESKTFQLYEIAKANLKKDATPNLDENEKFSG